MRTRLLGFCSTCCLVGILNSMAMSQQSIDGSFAFQSDPAKKYSLYVPSNYSGNIANSIVLALHPLHQVWGNASTWRDILSVFAETNSLILAAPDGGPDGRIDDPIDKAFMTALLDSVESWYTVDLDKVFILGFSWGARATYSFGLENHQRFAGFVTIGAFINGTQGLTETQLSNARGKPFYIMHGDRDNIAPIATAFFPIRDELINRGAIVRSLVLQGVNHTIEFANRDQIISNAYLWADSVSTDILLGIDDFPSAPEGYALIKNYPNPFNAGTKIRYNLETRSQVELTIFDTLGRQVIRLVDDIKPPGFHSREWRGLDRYSRPVASGVYFYQIRATPENQNREMFTETQKMLLFK